VNEPLDALWRELGTRDVPTEEVAREGVFWDRRGPEGTGE
jgi:hypothetical protein